MKTVLITGASGGIGLETVKLFLKKGYHVIAQYNKNKQALEDLKNESSSYVLSIYKADFSNPNEIKEMFSSITKTVKHFDVLVNNAGIDLYKMITDTTIEEWDKIFNVNVKATFLLTNLVLPFMLERKQGKIVNVSSVFGLYGASMEVAYSATKSAIIGYTKSLAKEVAPSNVYVNCVCPGAIDTEMNARFTKEEMDDIKNQTPLLRLGTPKDVANLIYFLSSEESDFITGECIKTDGGWTL